METGHAPGSRLAAAASLVLLATLPAAGAAQTGDTSPRAVADAKATVHAFHEALAAGDSTRALELLHPEVRVFEGGHVETRSEYRSGHLAADMEFASGVEREVLEEHLTRSGDRALYLSEYRMAGTFRGERVELHGAETMVLDRTDGGWKIRHIHWSSR